MEFPGKKIAAALEAALKKEVKKSKKKIKLTAILVGDAKDQLSFVRIKAQTAKRLGIGFELVNLKKIPTFENFMHILKEKSQDPDTAGIIIQQPLPAQLLTSSLYDYLPLLKEVEGHKNKTSFMPPLGLAILTVFKYLYGSGKINKDLLIDINRDRNFFKKTLKNKKIILIGRGPTGGEPIGHTLNEMKINYISTNSQTPDAAAYYIEGDVIITAVGKKVLEPVMLKPGVVLMNVGMHHEGDRLKGDYDEKEIKNIASFYTPTPGGVGPIDVLYLYKNLIDAAKMQKK